MRTTNIARPVIIIGASGHGKVIADIIQKSGDKVVGFLDDSPKIDKDFIGFPVLGIVGDYKKYENHDTEFVIAIGNAIIREKIAKKLDGVKWYTAIHPTAVISGIDVEIGVGSVIMANVVINAGAKIGKHCIINSGAIVEHDNRIADFVHVSVGAKLAGTVSVGKSSWIGIGSSVSNNVNICDNCMIGTGAVVIKDIKKRGTYVGVPAERIDEKMNKYIQESHLSNFAGGGAELTE